MIFKKGHNSKYLRDYRDGKIPMGLGIGCDLDDYLRWKDSQLNIILGHDNIGKSYWVEWYFLALATIHGQTFTLFMDENYSGKIFRDLIQMYVGKPFKTLTDSELTQAEEFIENHFKIIDNRKRYTPDELIKVFKDTGTTNALIDPFNGLKMPLNYANNYDVLNNLKLHCKQTKQTIYINAHPATNSGRRGLGFYPETHEWAGHVSAPVKADIEGGKPFGNKADDFIILHRLIKHPSMWMMTMLEVDKIKDTDTGGKPTTKDFPLTFDYNRGLGFKINSKDVIKHLEVKKGNSIFDEFSDELNDLPF